MAIYTAFNAARPTTAILAKVTTGTALKTMLQIATPATKSIRVIEWGISFDGFAAAAPISVGLINTKAVAATVTAHAATGIMKTDRPDGPASLVTLGTGATGFTATAEGTVTDSIVYDHQLVAPTNQYVKQFPLGREPFVAISQFLRIRLIAGAAVNANCYITWEE